MERRLPFKRPRQGDEDVADEGLEPTPERDEDTTTPPASPPSESRPVGHARRLFGGSRDADQEPEAQPPVPPQPARPVRPRPPNLATVRRERRALVRDRERRLRDLGGLLLEMYRRDLFREDILLERCAQAMTIENRIHELDAIIAHRTAPRRAAPGPRCVCGAALLFGARFCASCGRPADLVPPAAACSNCGQSLPAEGAYCGSCGTKARGAEIPSVAAEDTISHPPRAEQTSEENDDPRPAIRG